VKSKIKIVCFFEKMIYIFRLKAFPTTTKESERSIVSPVNLAAKTKNKNSKTILIDRNIARTVFLSYLLFSYLRKFRLKACLFISKKP
jgi:hypothetical protein